MLQPEGELFGARLRELREQRGQTQRSLADLMGIQHPYISEMERGLKVPSLTTIIRLAVALECEVTDLVDVFNGRDLQKFVPKRK
ncbi:MAG TPA: helix-turn-helix transcriptional regulator [Thermoanaerobaculia bacterium]